MEKNMENELQSGIFLAYVGDSSRNVNMQHDKFP